MKLKLLLSFTIAHLPLLAMQAPDYTICKVPASFFLDAQSDSISDEDAQLQQAIEESLMVPITFVDETDEIIEKVERAKKRTAKRKARSKSTVANKKAMAEIASSPEIVEPTMEELEADHEHNAKMSALYAQLITNIHNKQAQKEQTEKNEIAAAAVQEKNDEINPFLEQENIIPCEEKSEEEPILSESEAALSEIEMVEEQQELASTSNMIAEPVSLISATEPVQKFLSKRAQEDFNTKNGLKPHKCPAANCVYAAARESNLKKHIKDNKHLTAEMVAQKEQTMKERAQKKAHESFKRMITQLYGKDVAIETVDDFDFAQVEEEKLS